MTAAVWPKGFVRVPNEPWAATPVAALAQHYDTVEQHGWYRNLDPTVDALVERLEAGGLVMDYSGGTGILAARLLPRVTNAACGVAIVDSSPKFLRVALEKFRADDRVAFRRLRFLKDTKRLQFAHEVVGETMLERGFDVVVSTNAVHLYFDLEDTFASWFRVTKPGGAVHVQSGNILLPAQEGAKHWIIDDTVHAMHDAAVAIVQEDARFAAYRDAVADDARMAAHDAYRRRVFMPPRPLSTYEAALKAAGFTVTNAVARPVAAFTKEWLDFLAVYHDAILGWVGGSDKVEGAAPSEAAIRDRRTLLDAAARRVFEGADTFYAAWVYIDATRPR